MLYNLKYILHTSEHDKVRAIQYIVKEYVTNIVEPAGAGRTRSGLHSTSSTDYTVPRLHAKFAERVLSYAGPSAWNGLSEDLHTVADAVDFRKQLKTHFLTADVMFADICSCRL